MRSAGRSPPPMGAGAAPRRAPRRVCPSTPVDAGPARNLRLELVQDRRDRDDVALELQLRLLEPCGDADQLREVQDRHRVVLAGRLLQLRLPGVEREVAER